MPPQCIHTHLPTTLPRRRVWLVLLVVVLAGCVSSRVDVESFDARESADLSTSTDAPDLDEAEADTTRDATPPTPETDTDASVEHDIHVDATVEIDVESPDQPTPTPPAPELPPWQPCNVPADASPRLQHIDTRDIATLGATTSSPADGSNTAMFLRPARGAIDIDSFGQVHAVLHDGPAIGGSHQMILASMYGDAWTVRGLASARSIRGLPDGCVHFSKPDMVIDEEDRAWITSWYMDRDFPDPSQRCVPSLQQGTAVWTIPNVYRPDSEPQFLGVFPALSSNPAWFSGGVGADPANPDHAMLGIGGEASIELLSLDGARALLANAPGFRNGDKLEFTVASALGQVVWHAAYGGSPDNDSPYYNTAMGDAPRQTFASYTPFNDMRWDVNFVAVAADRLRPEVAYLTFYSSRPDAHSDSQNAQVCDVRTLFGNVWNGDAMVFPPANAVTVLQNVRAARGFDACPGAAQSTASDRTRPTLAPSRGGGAWVIATSFGSLPGQLRAAHIDASGAVVPALPTQPDVTLLRDGTYGLAVEDAIGVLHVVTSIATADFQPSQLEHSRFSTRGPFADRGQLIPLVGGPELQLARLDAYTRRMELLDFDPNLALRRTPLLHTFTDEQPLALVARGEPGLHTAFTFHPLSGELRLHRFRDAVSTGPHQTIATLPPGHFPLGVMNLDDGTLRIPSRPAAGNNVEAIDVRLDTAHAVNDLATDVTLGHAGRTFRPLGLVDIDGSGVEDIVWAETHSGRIWIWLADNDGITHGYEAGQVELAHPRALVPAHGDAPGWLLDHWPGATTARGVRLISDAAAPTPDAWLTDLPACLTIDGVHRRGDTLFAVFTHRETGDLAIWQRQPDGAVYRRMQDP